ncbi:MAG: hypothetical protein JWM37_443 [Candidatus Saccharibacteria bacterium]|nr:hypothetical protein [Candidatus Saccharibacteria bacterium]
MMQEAAIIQAVIEGKNGYAELVERYHVGLIIHCERLVGDRTDAEDVAQEAFVKAYLNLKNYDADKARFSTWLYKIATNLAIDYLRKERRISHEADVETLAELSMPTQVELAERNELRAIVAALEPPAYKQVIEGYYWQGKSYQELAEELRVPLNTVRTWIHRAKEQLKEQLV